jgi:hypothetical protein
MGARRTFPDDKSWKRRRGERRGGEGMRLRRQVAKAVVKITDDTEALLTFYDFPADH